MYPSLILLLDSKIQNGTESILDNVLLSDREFFITVWPQYVCWVLKTFPRSHFEWELKLRELDKNQLELTSR